MNASANVRDIELEKLEGRSLFAAADPVLLWNAVALDAVADDYAVGVDPEQKGPTATARALAIVHAAIYDAVNAFGHAFEPYLVSVKAPATASSRTRACSRC